MTALIDEATFFDRYGIVPDPDSGSDYWDEPNLARMGIPTERTWTVVDADTHSGQYVLAGLHLVNRVAPVVTERPWTTGDEIAVWSFPTCDTCGEPFDPEEAEAPDTDGRACPAGHGPPIGSSGA